MKWLFYEKETDTKARVMLIYFREPTPEELAEINMPYITIDEISAKPYQKGKTALEYCNPQTGEFWYEFVDRPLTPEEAIEEQNDKISTLILMMLEKEGII